MNQEDFYAKLGSIDFSGTDPVELLKIRDTLNKSFKLKVYPHQANNSEDEISWLKTCINSRMASMLSNDDLNYISFIAKEILLLQRILKKLESYEGFIKNVQTN